MRPPLTIALAPVLLASCGARSGLWDVSSQAQDASPPPSSLDSGVSPESGTGGAAADGGADALVPVACPTELPTLASACVTEGEVCAYHTGKAGPCDDVGTDDQSVFRCEEGRWLVIARCVDWKGCPSAPPADGSPCSAPGLDCFYSRDTCAPESIVQCDGPIWRHVNACEPGSIHGCISLVETLAGDTVIAPEEGKDVSMPSIALAGTQALLTYLRSAGDSQEHDIYATLVQTAVPSMAPLYNAPGFKVGRDAVTNPVAAFGVDRFVVSWGANDGWPVSTSGVPGIFVRAMQLDNAPGDDILVDGTGIGPSGLALGPDGGWLGYRTQALSDPSLYAAHRVALDGTQLPEPETNVLVADESQSEWFAPPVPNATVRIARNRDGFAIAYPVIASGDYWDDSGILVEFHSMDSHVALSTVRATTGLPVRLSLALLRDGSAMLAYTRLGEESEPSAPPFHLARVYGDGTFESLPDPMSDGFSLAFGPKVVAAEDGVALVWTTSDPDAPNPLVKMYLALVGPDGSYGAETSRPLSPLASDDRLDLAYSSVDRAVHLVWSPVSGLQGQADHLVYQRYVCGVGIK